MIRSLAIVALSVPVLFAIPAAAQQEPALHDNQLDLVGKAPQPKSKIYDEKADAKAAIDAALAKATKEHQRVLVQWGANWCPWCHKLHDIFKSDRDIAKELNYEYQVVLVDVGQFDKNMELAAGYKADLKGTGIPYLTVLGADGKPIANQETGALEDADKTVAKHDAAKVLAFLKSQQAPALDAKDVLAGGVSRAGTDGKRVFLHFGAPWCGWCHRLEDWMARPQIAAILAKDFVDVKIDTDRMTGGQELLAATRGGKDGGIPWFVILDAADASHPKPMITSDAPKTGNIGFPSEAAEIEYFIGMMKKAAVKMTPEDIETLRKSLLEKEKPAADAPKSVPMQVIRPAGKQND